MICFENEVVSRDIVSRDRENRDGHPAHTSRLPHPPGGQGRPQPAGLGAAQRERGLGVVPAGTGAEELQGKIFFNHFIDFDDD